MSFADLGIAEPILRSVLAAGYETPSPIQAQSIPPAMLGRDVLGCAQTGTGKTAAFALPILHRLTLAGNPPKGHGRRVRVLVIAPTRELACQICDSFLAYGKHTPLRVITVYGGVNQTLQVRALRNGVDIMIATPGRLVDLMGQGHVDLSNIQALVLDEADRMFDMGFAPDLNKIFAQLPQDRQTLLFSATMPGPIENLARALLKDPVRVEIAPVQTTTELIEQSVVHIPKAMKAQVLAGYLKSTDLDRAIVFTKTKHGADRVAKTLNKAGFSADAIHGDKRQNIRQRILADFKGNRIRVLVATDIAARGIDVDGITHVINHDLPMEPETYVHRIGRTGRAGAKGTALSFCSPDERRLLGAIERLNRMRIPVADLGIKELIANSGMDSSWEERVEERPRRVPPHRGGAQGSDRNGDRNGPRPEGARFGERQGAGRFGRGPEKFGRKPAPRRPADAQPQFGGSRGNHTPLEAGAVGEGTPAGKTPRPPRSPSQGAPQERNRSRRPQGESFGPARFDSSVEPARREPGLEEFDFGRRTRVEFIDEASFGEGRRPFVESRLPGKGGSRGPRKPQRKG